MKISIIYATARDDYPLMDLPKDHHFTVFLGSLKQQTFKDFEVIISDVLYKKRKYDFSKYSFPIKHIDPNEFSWALKKGIWGLQDTFNMAIIHADGELLLWFNDCCELTDQDSLQIWWDWYQKGYFAHALATYLKGGKPIYAKDRGCLTDVNCRPENIRECGKVMIKEIIESGRIADFISDSRWKFVGESPNGIYYCLGEHFYGYSSSSLESTLRVNGHDSNLDGDQALGDIDIGMRLERIGYKFVCDKRLWVIEHSHINVSSDALFGIPKSCFRSNYSLIMLNKQKNKITANDYKLTNKELEWILNHGTKWSVPRPSPGTREHELLMDWFNNPPIFNLTELRNARLRREGKIE